ncbi:hypothetical protein LRE75_34385 [Streptomyces sp. 372A]
MPEFNEFIAIALQMLPHMFALFDRTAARASGGRSGPCGVCPPAVPLSVPGTVGTAALLEMVHGMPPGTVLRYESPDGTVLTCWAAPGTEPGEYRLW